MVKMRHDFMKQREIEKPERTHCNPSRKLETASIGNMTATYWTTSISLL